MSEQPKYLKELETELSTGTLSELLEKSPEIDPAEVQKERNQK